MPIREYLWRAATGATDNLLPAQLLLDIEPITYVLLVVPVIFGRATHRCVFMFDGVFCVVARRMQQEEAGVCPHASSKVSPLSQAKEL